MNNLETGSTFSKRTELILISIIVIFALFVLSLAIGSTVNNKILPDEPGIWVLNPNSDGKKLSDWTKISDNPESTFINVDSGNILVVK